MTDKKTAEIPERGIVRFCSGAAGDLPPQERQGDEKVWVNLRDIFTHHGFNQSYLSLKTAGGRFSLIVMKH